MVRRAQFGSGSGANPNLVFSSRQNDEYYLRPGTSDYQAEIDNAGASSRLVFLPGTHDVDQTFLIQNDDVTIEIRQGATVQPTSGAGLTDLIDTDDNLSNVFLEGRGTINGNGEVGGQLLRFGNGLSRYGARDLQFRGGDDTAITAASPGSNLSERAWFDNLDIADTGNECFYIRNCDRVWITDCDAQSNTDDVYELVDSVTNGYIARCYAEGGIAALDLFCQSGTMEKITVDGLFAVNSGDGGTSPAISVGSGGDTIQHVTIKNSHIDSPTLNYIRCRPTGTINNLTFKDNICRGSGSNPGIDIRNGSNIWVLDNREVGGGFNNIDFEAGVTGLIDRNLTGGVTAPDATIGTNYSP